ncbi:MAG TPA: PIG-L family deacetylase [Actinomycetota bacterium]|nr:PIG-L family deacetylase [Actinomycetota bacterium]
MTPNGPRVRLAGVFAHPDDDTFSIAATVARHAPDIEVLSILATSGEAGEIAPGTVATRETLGEVRDDEARAAYAALGAPLARIELLREPDGGLGDADRESLVARVTERLVEFAPTVVVTFGQDGVTKHVDHVTIGAVATEAFHRARERSRAPRAFRRLLYTAIPWSLIREWQRAQVEAGQEPMDPDAPFMPRGVDDDTIAIEVDARPVIDAVIAAFRAHRTQAGAMEDMPEDRLPDIFRSEHFVMAWPEREPGTPRLSDVFHGLDPA